MRFWQVSLILIFIGSFSSLLTGCGFHLKGMGEQSQATYQTVRLIDLHKVNPDVKRVIIQQFRGMNVKVVNNLADADVAVTFQATGFQATSTGRTGRGDVASQLLKMSQPIVVDNVQTGQQILTTTVTSFRDRNINNQNLQASSRELASIQKQMATDLALQVIDRVNRVYSHSQSVQK